MFHQNHDVIVSWKVDFLLDLEVVASVYSHIIIIYLNLILMGETSSKVKVIYWIYLSFNKRYLS